MRIRMQRVALGLIGGIGALALAGCSSGWAPPTGPSGLTSAVGAPASAGATASPGGYQDSTQDRPFTGTLSLAVAGDPEFIPPATLSIQFVTTGTAAHLGRFTGTLDLRIDMSNEPHETSTGQFTMAANNGDTVSGTIAGRAMADDTGTSIVETATITGGTGRFAGATGSFVITRRSTDLELFPGSFEGTIRY
jgi:hypothetical protein